MPSGQAFEALINLVLGSELPVGDATVNQLRERLLLSLLKGGSISTTSIQITNDGFNPVIKVPTGELILSASGSVYIRRFVGAVLRARLLFQDFNFPAKILGLDFISDGTNANTELRILNSSSQILLGILHDGGLKFYEPAASGVNFSSFKAQAQAGNIDYTLPAADGAPGTKLTTDGAGNLSWT